MLCVVVSIAMERNPGVPSVSIRTTYEANHRKVVRGVRYGLSVIRVAARTQTR